MERHLRLFLFWFIWLRCNKAEKPEIGRLIIRSNEHIDETIAMTDCNCDLDGEMQFSIASHLLPDITSDFSNTIEFADQAFGCTGVGGHIDFDPATEINVVFKVNENCGVHINNGQLPIYIAETFSGHKMEATIPLKYRGSSGNYNNLLAHMTCVCPDDNVEQGPCKNSMFEIDQSFQCDKEQSMAPPGTTCIVETDQLADCGIAIERIDTTIHYKGQFSLLPDENGRYDCRFIHDEEDYINVAFDIVHDVTMPITTSTDAILTDVKYHVHYSCLKPATWTRWSGWSSCSVTCGSGHRIKRRFCNNGAVGLPGCEGLDEEKENCDGKHACPGKCPVGTTMSEHVKCECDTLPKARYVLFPLALASHANIQSSLTFKSAPDMERTVVIVREHKGQVNFQPVTSEMEVTWMFDKHSPMSDIGHENWGHVKILSESILFETIWPISLENMRIRSQNKGPTSAEEEAKYHENIIGGVYQLSFQSSSIIDIGDSYESVMTVLVHLSDTANEEILLVSKLDKLEHWCSDSTISETIPPSLIAPVPLGCHTNFPECIEVDIPDETLVKNCGTTDGGDVDHLPDPVEDIITEVVDEECPAIRVICDATQTDINPCNLGINGGNIGSVSFSTPENCGECINCNQLQVTCQAGIPHYTSVGCGELCIPCTDEDYGKSPFPVWQAWGNCDKICGGGSVIRFRDTVPQAEVITLSQQLTCQADFNYFNSANEESKDCNTLCCGCCDLPVEEQCPEGVLTECSAWPECTDCNQVDTTTCTYNHQVNDCKMQCKHTRQCNDDCCNIDDAMDVAHSHSCVSEHDCAVGEWQWQVTSKCESILDWAATKTGGQCQRETSEPCTCTNLKADISEYDCVDVTFDTPCVVRGNTFVKVTKHCKLKEPKKGKYCVEYDHEEPCVASVCDLAVGTNCCRKTSCDALHYTLDSCKTQNVCLDQQGEEFVEGSVDCCKDKSVCTGNQIKTCKPCEGSFAKPPECLSATNNVFCQQEDCKYPVYKCPSCQAAFCRLTTGEDINVVTVTIDLLNSVQFDLPAKLYTPKVRFFIGSPDSFNTEGCYHDFDRDEPDLEVTLHYKRSELFQCGIANENSQDGILKTTIYVDKSNAVSTDIGTHTPFVRIDCETKPTTVEQTIIVAPNFGPVEFKGVIPGDVKIDFDISTDKDFSVLMEDSDDLNAVLVGELLYARIVSDKEFKITRCTMYDNNNPTHRFNLLVDGCPDEEDFTNIFHFKYLETSQAFTTVFQWQNFIFREGAEEQVLVYECQVAPCYDDCQPTCNGRKRRQTKSVQSDPSVLFNPTRFNFFLEVYNTRQALEEALRTRRNEYTQEMLITICSSVLLFGLVLGFATYWLNGYGKSDENIRKPFRIDSFQSQLKSMLDAKFRRQDTPPPPPYAARLPKNNNEFGKTVEMLIDDPNFITKTLTPQLEIKTHND